MSRHQRDVLTLTGEGRGPAHFQGFREAGTRASAAGGRLPARPLGSPRGLPDRDPLRLRQDQAGALELALHGRLRRTPGRERCTSRRGRSCRSGSSRGRRRRSSCSGLVFSTYLCPRVYQSGERDLRGPLAKQGPRYRRWALVEAATHACTARSTATATSRPKRGSASCAAPRSPRSTSPAASPKDLAHAQPPPTLRSQRRHRPLAARRPLRRCATGANPNRPCPPRGGDREMSPARHPRPRHPP
jgi:hypothetical protein